MSDAAPEKAPATAEYEFTGAQNALIGELAGVMNVAGLVLMALAIVAILYGAVFLVSGEHDPTPLVFVAFCAPMVIAGFWVRRASEMLRRIVDTEGRDITHLMETFAELRRIFALLAKGFAASLSVAVAAVVFRAFR